MGLWAAEARRVLRASYWLSIESLKGKNHLWAFGLGGGSEILNPKP